MRRTAFVNQVHLGPTRSIPSQDTCDKLDRALPYIPPGSQNFARSLIQNHATYNGWTPKQAEHANLLLERAREAYRETKVVKAKVVERSKVSDDAMRGLNRMVRFGAKAIKANSFTLKPAKDGGFTLSMGNAYCGNLRSTGTLDLRLQKADKVEGLLDRLEELGIGALLHNTDQ